jgi:CheY-like chemotaxis protein
MPRTGIPPGPAPEAKRRPVLIIEDDVGTHILIAEAVRQAGFGDGVLLARTGAQALEVIASLRRQRAPAPAVVLLDLRLPDQSGLDVLRTLRKEPASRHLPVVIFSGSTDPRDVRQAYDAGANGFVEKPVRYPALATALASALTYWVDVNVPPGADGSH